MRSNLFASTLAIALGIASPIGYWRFIHVEIVIILLLVYYDVIVENIQMVKALQPEKDEQDSPWKKMVRDYLQEGIEFFFPDVAAIVDWTKPPVFLDKEFVQIAPDAKVGEHYADQLVQLQRKKGTPIVLLLHIEIQASPEGQFAERMFIYALRIFDLFRQPALSLAILCDANPKWRPKQYSFALPQTSLNFEFGTVKLLDYKERWAELESSGNPFAWVVMAHLKMQETKQDKAIPTEKITD